MSREQRLLPGCPAWVRSVAAEVSRGAGEGFAGWRLVEPRGSAAWISRRAGEGLLHGCPGEIKGVAAWMSWGDLKRGFLDGCLEVLLGGCQRERGEGLQDDFPRGL